MLTFDPLPPKQLSYLISVRGFFDADRKATFYCFVYLLQFLSKVSSLLTVTFFNPVGKKVSKDRV
jgi:hypothetical protein